MCKEKRMNVIHKYYILLYPAVTLYCFLFLFFSSSLFLSSLPGLPFTTVAHGTGRGGYRSSCSGRQRCCWPHGRWAGRLRDGPAAVVAAAGAGAARTGSAGSSSALLTLGLRAAC